MSEFEDKLTVQDGYPVKDDDNSEPYDTPADELATINRWLEAGLANLPGWLDADLWRADFLVYVYGEGMHPSVASKNALRTQLEFFSQEEVNFYENLLTPTNL